MSSETRRQAAIECCETLLAPGRKWHLSPYVMASLDAAGLGHLAHLIPVYQSVILDLLAARHLPSHLSPYFAV